MNDLPTNKTIFIPGNVPSSKNSKQWTGRYLVHSKATQRYIKESKIYWEKYRKQFHKMIEGRDKPYRIGFYFFRKTKRKFDLINAAQMPCDLMVKHGWIDDDNADEIVPVFLGHEHDKENPGMLISVTDY